MEILELVAADKHAYHFYQHREFVEVMNHQLCSFGTERLMKCILTSSKLCSFSEPSQTTQSQMKLRIE
jgi:hypothetical protein